MCGRSRRIKNPSAALDDSSKVWERLHEDSFLEDSSIVAAGAKKWDGWKKPFRNTMNQEGKSHDPMGSISFVIYISILICSHPFSVSSCCFLLCNCILGTPQQQGATMDSADTWELCFWVVTCGFCDLLQLGEIGCQRRQRSSTIIDHQPPLTMIYILYIRYQ